MPNPIHPELTLDHAIRAWCVEAAVRLSDRYVSTTAAEVVASAAVLESYVSGARASVVAGKSVGNLGNQLEDVGSINIGTVGHVANDGFTLSDTDIDHGTPNNGFSAVGNITHNSTPVVGLDAATVSQAGGGVNASAGEG